LFIVIRRKRTQAFHLKVGVNQCTPLVDNFVRKALDTRRGHATGKSAHRDAPQGFVFFTLSINVLQRTCPTLQATMPMPGRTPRKCA